MVAPDIKLYDRKQVGRLLEQLPEEDMSAAGRLLERLLAGRDSFLRHLLELPEEEEELSDEGKRLLDEGYEDLDAGRTYTAEEVRRELGL